MEQIVADRAKAYVHSNPRRTAAIVACLAASLGVLTWTTYEANRLRGVSVHLDARPAGKRMLDWQLAPSAAAADAIVNDWRCVSGPPCRDFTSEAVEALKADGRFIWSYLFTGVLLVTFATLAARVRWRWAVVFSSAVAIAAGLDHLENWSLAASLGREAELPFNVVASALATLFADRGHAHVLAVARVAAMTKWTLLLIAVWWVLVCGIGGLRRLALALRPIYWQPVRASFTFERLMTLETRGIFKHFTRRAADKPECLTNAAADEPYVSFRAADLVGLSLSGGGIRSATFNLGLLQGLQRLHLLRLFDYTSTVSGGGYIGGFWSAWLKRHPQVAPEVDDTTLFPTVAQSGPRPSRQIDRDEERHLREFGAFLAPRMGFFEVETWTAVVAFLGGLFPALLIGLSLLGMTLIGWLVVTFPLASASPWAAAGTAGLVTAGVLVVFERLWQTFKRESSGRSNQPGVASAHGRAWYRVFSFVAVAIVTVFQLNVASLYQDSWPIWRRADAHDRAAAARLVTGTLDTSGTRVEAALRIADEAPQAAADPWTQATTDSGVARWWDVTGMAHRRSHLWQWSPRLFDYAVAWLGCGTLLLLLRVASALHRWPPHVLASFDRVVMRLLGLGAIWAGGAALWHVSINLERIGSAAMAAVATAGGFAALRNWLGEALGSSSSPSPLSRLKPLLPQTLAYVTVFLAATVVGARLIEINGDVWFAWWQTAAIMSGVLAVGLFIQPGEFGLHKFYRDRLARAYTGACNLAHGQTAADNRGTEARDDDDPELKHLEHRPLHLVCCAANDLSGDQVETLTRGARSAVLSAHGLALGSAARAWTGQSVDTSLGAAITASAAAFNSNMGQLSTRLGPAVAFLMTTLNLRLGLWVRHPRADQAGPRRWPGLLLYREMFGLTSSSGRTRPHVEAALRDVHLSDGGHFENLALYELVRRHCRYILVSDCGADPKVAFDDLGNAIRRIREDFGVDVELDVRPLRPDDKGISLQHVAVGVIHYSPNDRGILLYVKPSLTGDEPPDVQQYRSRNAAFPHESTGDQLYDEAQWESYRRLGLHVAQTVLGFVSQTPSEGRNVSADWTFAEARHRWGPTPAGLKEKVLEMSARFDALDNDLMDLQRQGRLRDVFPELAFMPGEWPPLQGANPNDKANQADELVFLLKVTQLMEDVWLACELDQWWSHPLNIGWINLFARWATTDAFRFWWPLMAPMFSVGFRSFIQERFPARSAVNALQLADPMQGKVREVPDPFNANRRGLAALWWQTRSAHARRFAASSPERRYYENVLELSGPDRTNVLMQVGLACISFDIANGDTRFGWTSDDFFVPPSLWGASLGWLFLKGLIHELSGRENPGGPSRPICHVVVKAPRGDERTQVARDDRKAFMEQYRKMGFREVRRDMSRLPQVDRDWFTLLGYDAQQDTLFELKLTANTGVA